VRFVAAGVGVGVGDGVGLGEGDGVGLGEGDGVGLGEGDGVGLGVPPLNVTVIAALGPATPSQGFVVPEQVVAPKSVTALQPPNVDPPLAVALNVIVAPLAVVVIFGEHVLFTV
jgi:hypothetical protein